MNMLNVKEINEKKIWEDFLNNEKIAFYPFFQSWNWGEVQRKNGYEVLRLGLYNQKINHLVGVCQIVEIKAKRGHYLHLRHGPVLLEFSPEHFDFFLHAIKKLAKEKGAGFLRLSPLLKKDAIDEIFFKHRKFLPAPIHILDAEVGWMLEITKSEEELLKDMRKSHRYLIRKALAMPITIHKTKDPSQIDFFFPLYEELAQRKNFVPHRAIKEEYEIFSKDDECLLFLAEYEGKIISVALIDFVRDMAIYRHSASLHAFQHIPSSYLIQWQAILEAKKRGMRRYHFWGIADSDSPKHPWQGLTLFKTGFGGEKVEFVHAQDLPLSPKYWFTFAVEMLTKIKKGY